MAFSWKFSYLSSRINHFSKGSWFLLVWMIFRNRDLSAGYAHCYHGIINSWLSHCNSYVYMYTYTLTSLSLKPWMYTNTFILIQHQELSQSLYMFLTSFSNNEKPGSHDSQWIYSCFHPSTYLVCNQTPRYIGQESAPDVISLPNSTPIGHSGWKLGPKKGAKSVHFKWKLISCLWKFWKPTHNPENYAFENGQAKKIFKHLCWLIQSVTQSKHTRWGKNFLTDVLQK